MKAKNRNPVKASHRKRWNKVVELGCAVINWECMGRITIHHCGTAAGGRKDHDKVIGLCWNHHQSKEYGIDGKGRFTKASWQEHYKTEDELLAELDKKLKINIDLD